MSVIPSVVLEGNLLDHVLAGRDHAAVMQFLFALQQTPVCLHPQQLEERRGFRFLASSWTAGDPTEHPLLYDVTWTPY
jgi:hypothetical protein